MVRDLIKEGHLGELQKVLSPGVYDLISNNIGRIQNRANVLPSIIEDVKQTQGIKLSDIEQQIKAVGISRIDNKKAENDPEYAAKVEVLKELRQKRDNIKSSASFEPHRLLASLAARQPEKYGLDLSTTSAGAPPMRTMSSGMVQRFENGGKALSPLLQSIYDSMKDKPEWLKEFGLPNNVTTDVPAKTIAQLYSGKAFPIDPSLGMFAGKPISIDNVNAVWRKSFASSMSPEKTAQYTAAKNYLAKTLKADTTEQTKLTIRDVNKSTKLGIVGLQPADKKEIEGPMQLGNKNVTLFIAGLSSEYDKAIKNMRSGVEGVVGQFGSDIQDTKIFGSSEKYAFDFDETLVTGADILDANGKPDIPRYGDIGAVRESMKGAKLTQLGEKVKKLMSQDPSFIKKSRILTARPQETAGILAETLQRLELPFQESDITGVSKPIGGGKLDIVDEKTQRINNSTIAKAKAQDVKDLEALIDDNLQNVTETKKAGKKAFHHTELKSLTPQEKAASGFPNIEGAITQAVMAVMGATGGLIQNGAVDYEHGLGPAAQYFPGIGSDWPTEVKRTLDSNAISDAKKEFTRYYKENGNKGILAEAFANGGEVQKFKLGGEAYNLEKGSGLSSFEFDEAKRFADSAGYNVEEFKEYLAKRLANKKQNANLRMDPASLLRAITPEKNTSTPKQLALAEMLKGEPDAGYRPTLTDAQRLAASRGQTRSSALTDINNATRFAVGGVAEPKQKKEKQYGKIGLTEDGTMINAGYFQNDTRSGYATAYKMRDYLYYVGLSSATSGYGPKLYDVLMEAATEKGAMLTSDRSMVSGDAKNVWGYYFNNRPDVQKTPLKPSDWTRNNSLIDPKLYGKEETWPPANDPAWILQSGYSKSPSLINSKDVIRSSGKVDSRALMSSFFSAKRGSSEPVVASNSNGEEFTIGYAKMATGGKVDPRMDEYKQILSSILPPEFLSKEGLLKTPGGGSEEMEILSPKKKSFFDMFKKGSSEEAPPASYEGGLPYKALRHNLDKIKDQIPPEEYARLQKYIQGSLAWHGGHDVIDVRKTFHRGALPHETFHDIQGYLYDHYPEMVDKIFSSIDSNRPQIEDWYNNKADSSYRGPEQYNLSHFFPEGKNANHVNRPFLRDTMAALQKNKKGEIGEMPSTPSLRAVDASSLDLGRNELLPVLLSAASEGDSSAADILSNIFGSAGLNKDFYKTLPRFANGGVVPGVGDGDTVPATLNVGDFVIRKKAVETIGAAKLAGMSRYASGGSVDKVPALLTPGEFVFNRQSAQKIGYNKLHQLNRADKIAGYNKGGAVGVVQKFAAGGDAKEDRPITISSIANSIIDWLKTEQGPAIPKLVNRPDTPSRASLQISNGIQDSIKEVIKALNDLGVSSSTTAELINKGGTLSYKITEKALKKDIERMTIAGASIDQIAAAEKILAAVRSESKTKVGQTQKLENSFRNSNIGQKLGSGGAQQEIISEANKIEKSLQKQYIKYIASKLQMPGLPGATPADKIKRATEIANDPEEKAKIKERAYLRATQNVTGVKKSEFTKEGLSGSDIQKYITESLKDRKTLASMDKQLIASKIEELQNSSEYRAATDAEQSKMLASIKEAATKEVSIRREIINDLAKETGGKGVGAAGLTDFRNSPILKTLKGIAPSTYISGAATAAGFVSSNADSIAKNFYDTSTDKGKIGAAKTGGALSGASTIASTGLGVAAKSLAFDPSGTLAIITVIGTGLVALGDSIWDFTGSQEKATKEVEKALRAKEISAATSNLDDAFKKLEKNINNLDLQDAFNRSLSESVLLQAKDASANIDSTKADYAYQNRSWGDLLQLLPNFKGSAQMDATQLKEVNRGEAERFGPLAEKGYKQIANSINGGASIEQIMRDSKFKSARSAIALATPEGISEYTAAKAAKEKATGKPITETDRQVIINEIAARKILYNEIVLSAVAAKKTANALELADLAGRKLARSFDKLFDSTNQAISKNNFNIEQRKSSTEYGIGALSGNATIPEYRSQNIDILKNPRAYSSDQFQGALNVTAQGYSPEDASMIKGAATIQRDLAPVIESSIRGAITGGPGKPGKASLGLDEAAKIAKETGTAQINSLAGVPEELKRTIVQQLDAVINAQTNNDQVKEGFKYDNAGAVDKFLETIKDATDKALNNAGKGSSGALIEKETARQEAFNEFNKNLAKSSAFLKQYNDGLNKARKVFSDFQVSLKEMLTGIPQSFSDTKQSSMFETARLTGGITDPTAIGQNILNLQKQGSALQTNIQQANDNGETDKAAQFAIQLDKINNQINNSKEALDNLANSSDLVSKAFSEIQKTQEYMQNRTNLTDKLLTQTPEEAKKSNDVFARIQNNLNGGMNGAVNSREAREAFSQALRSGKGPQGAYRAGNTVLAQQRAESLEMFRNPDLRGSMMLRMEGQGMSREQADRTLIGQELQLKTQMAKETGQTNNPVVAAELETLRKKSRGEIPTELQAKEAQAQEAIKIQKDAIIANANLANAQANLISPLVELKLALEGLTKEIKNIRDKDAAVEGGAAAAVAAGKGIDVAVAPGGGVAPVGRAKGGVIYAEKGALINFEPKGTDTVPAMLTPGEFVVNARATQQHLPLLQAINENKGGKIPGFNQGGLIYLAAGGLASARRQQRKAQLEADKQSQKEISRQRKASYEARKSAHRTRNKKLREGYSVAEANEFASQEFPGLYSSAYSNIKRAEDIKKQEIEERRELLLEEKRRKTNEEDRGKDLLDRYDGKLTEVEQKRYEAEIDRDRLTDKRVPVLDKNGNPNRDPLTGQIEYRVDYSKSEGLERLYSNRPKGYDFRKSLSPRDQERLDKALSQRREQQAQKIEQQKQRERQKRQKEEQRRFLTDNPVQMLSDSPQATQGKVDKMANSMTYDSMVSGLGDPKISAPGIIDNTSTTIERAVTQSIEISNKPTAKKEPWRPIPTAAGLERERQRSLDLEYESKAERTKERVLASVAREGVWDPNAYDATYRRLMKSGVPTRERWKAAQFREAVEKELSLRSPSYAKRRWTGVVPSTHYTQSSEFKAQQEKKAKDREVKGPYAPGLPGEIDKAADQFKVGVAQASTLPIRTVAAVSDAMLEIGLPEDYSKQKRAVDKVRTKDQERATAITPQENARLAEDEKRKLIGTDRDAFGANVGDQAQGKFVKLSAGQQQEYLSLRRRAQKGMKPAEYTRLDMLQKTLGIPYQQREVIPRGYESDVDDPATRKKSSGKMSDMRDVRASTPLLGSRKYVEGLPSAFEEGATLGTVLTRESSAYGDRAKETAIGTGEVVTGTAKVGTGILAAGLADRVGMTGLVSPETAKAFKDSALETADLGRTQVELGAAKYGKNAGVDSALAMTYGESSPQATFYADQQRVQQKQFDATLQKQKTQAEDLAPGLGTSYERAENLSQSAYAAATAAAMQEVAVGAFTKPATAPAKTFSPEQNAAYAARNEAFHDNLAGKVRNIKTEGGATRLVGTSPTGFNPPPKPSTWKNGVKPKSSPPETDSQYLVRQLKGLKTPSVPKPTNPKPTSPYATVPGAPNDFDVADSVRATSLPSEATPRPQVATPSRSWSEWGDTYFPTAKAIGRKGKNLVKGIWDVSTPDRVMKVGGLGIGAKIAYELEVSNEEQRRRKEEEQKAKKAQRKATGGIVYANNGALISARSQGSDTVPAMLTPGEFVVNRASAQEHMPLLQAINNRNYESGGLVKYMAQGGVVTPQYKAMGGETTQQYSSSSNTSPKSNSEDSRLERLEKSMDKFIGVATTFEKASESMGNNVNQFSQAVTTMPTQMSHVLSATVNGSISNSTGANTQIVNSKHEAQIAVDNNNQRMDRASEGAFSRSDPTIMRGTPGAGSAHA